MNRCLTTRLLRFLALLMAVSSWTSVNFPAPVSAQSTQRQFPQAAVRGLLEVTAPPGVLLNGHAERLSPGARIRDANNMLVMSAALVGQRVLVNYVRDPLGLIHEVWILNELEAQEQRAGMDSASP